jgi:hypothetical protein
MTPTALTPAARAQRATTPRPSAPRPSATRPASPRASATRPASPHPSAPRATHRAPLRRPAGRVGPVPRRVSGPARPAPAAPQRTPRTPVRAPKVTVTVRRQPAVRVAGFVRTLPDRALLDRIVRGRLWIPLLGVLLVGIVAMQVEVLKLNAGIGRAMIRTAALQTQNQRLRDTVSQQADPNRLMTDAADQDMQMPAPSQPKFLPLDTGTQLARALKNIHAPDPTGFAQRTAAAQAAKAALVTSEPQ